MPIRWSDDAGFAGPLGGGLTASRARPPIGRDLGFADVVFLRVAGRGGVVLAAFFRVVLTLLTAFLRVPLLIGIFLRLGLALPFAFFLFAIAASLTLNAFRLWVAPHYPPKALKEKEKKTTRNVRDIKREESPAISATLSGTFA